MKRKDMIKNTIRDGGAKNQDKILSGSFLFFSARRLLTAFAGSSPGKLVFANSNAASYTVQCTPYICHNFSCTPDIKIWWHKGIFILMGYIFAGIHFLTNIKWPPPMPLVQHNSGKSNAIWYVAHLKIFKKKSQSTNFRTVQNVPEGCCCSFIMCIAICCTSERFMEALILG